MHPVSSFIFIPLLLLAMDSDEAWDLEMELLCLPATGGSVRKMQQVSQRISAACTGVPDHIRELAALPDNSHRERDLHRWVRRQPWMALLPELYEFEIPVTYDGLEETTGVHAALLPHETFASLGKYPELFKELLCGPDGNLQDFWQKSTGRWRTHHPIPEVHSAPGQCIPLGIFGDNAGVYAAQKVLVLLWGSVALEALTLDSRILFCSIMYALVVPIKTIAMLYEVLAWSLTWLAMGVHPDVDHRGVPFSTTHHPSRFKNALKPLVNGGYVGVFSELRGDWKWQVEALSLEHRYSTNFICHLCRASRKIPRLMYTQFRQHDHIRCIRISWRAFRDWQWSRPAATQSPLLKVVGFDIWRCWVDAMHCLDLGIYQGIAACCLNELSFEHVWPGDTLDDCFYAAHSEHKDWCKRKGLQPCPRFERRKLCPTGTFPTFTQQSAKAAMTKQLVLWLHEVLARPGVSQGPHGQIRFVMFEQWAAFEAICARNGRFLATPDKQHIADSVENALVCLNYLASEPGSLWHIKPKAHMSTHMAFDAAVEFGINPRRVTNYSDEDMVGRIKRVMRSCHGSSAGKMCMLRYAILVGTRWWSRLAYLRGIR